MPDCGSFSSKRDMGSMISKPRFVAPTVSTFAALPSSFAGWLGACVWCGFGCMATRGWKLNLQLTNPKRHELCLCQKAHWSAAQYKIAMNSGPHHFRLNCISKSLHSDLFCLFSFFLASFSFFTLVSSVLSLFWHVCFCLLFVFYFSWCFPCVAAVL